MSDAPATQYAEAADGTHLAYQVLGQGDLGLLFVPGVPIGIDFIWDDPGMQRIGRRLASFSRTVYSEIRGWGSSEGSMTEVRAGVGSDEDLVTVLDAAGCDQVLLFGSNLSSQAVIHFAATHPERVRSLVLLNAFCHYMRHDDYECGLSPQALETLASALASAWGTGGQAEVMAPSRSSDQRFRSWVARGERLLGGPGQATEVMRSAMALDYRHLLPSIQVPTLVLHNRGTRFIRVGAGRYLAEHIPGAKYVELPGDDMFFFVGDVDAWVDEVEEFLTGRRQPAEGEVILATVLFTDIVNSTVQEAAMGHRAWARLTEEHDALIRGALERHGGRAVKTLGDGFLATFEATTRAVRCAEEIVRQSGELGLELRAGLHNGEVELRDNDVAGLAVTIGKRICDLAGPGEVVVSETVRGHLVGSGFSLSERGTHVLKGVPEEWRLFAVEG